MITMMGSGVYNWAEVHATMVLDGRFRGRRGGGQNKLGNGKGLWMRGDVANVKRS